MKRETYLTSKGRPVASEADLLASLAADYRALLAEFPMRDKAWQAHVQSGNQTAREELAFDLMLWNRDLVRELRDGVPAWRAMALGMAYMDRVMRLRLPKMRTALGQIEREGKPGRKPQDELCMMVLRVLRADGCNWEQALDRMKAESGDDKSIVRGICVDHDFGRLRFSRALENQPDQLEDFSTETVRRKKWPKTRKDR